MTSVGWRGLCVAIALMAVVAGRAHAQDVQPRVVLISIDGLMPATYTGPDAAQRAPNLSKLARSGIHADGVIGVFPTVTYPSHTTLITGVEPARHGIFDNRILDPENRSAGAWNWYASAIRALTLPAAARARGLRTAAITWPVSIGMDADFLVPEYFRSSHPESLSMLRALSSPQALFDAAATSRGRPFGWPQTDRDRTDLTTFAIRTLDPHLLLLHLIELDGAEHTHGPGSAQAAETLARLDGYVGEIVEAVRAAGRADRTHVVIVSDHGFLPVTTQVQPNAAFRREGLLEVTERGDVASWQAYFHSSGGAGFVYLKSPELRGRVHEILRQLQKDPANGIRRIWTHEELRAAGAHPDADFGLDVVDGFYTGSGHDVLVKPSASRGGHGFAPDRPALHASFIMAGPAVKTRGSVGVIRMASIATTLASVLGVELPASTAPRISLEENGGGSVQPGRKRP